MPRNSWEVWNVRPSPRCAMALGLRPTIEAPSRKTSPRCGRWMPQMTLSSVVLPAPLGPMSAANLAWLHVEIDTFEHPDATEADVQVAHGEDGGAHRSATLAGSCDGAGSGAGAAGPAIRSGSSHPGS